MNQAPGENLARLVMITGAAVWGEPAIRSTSQGRGQTRFSQSWKFLLSPLREKLCRSC